jgi:DNA invertase Pin-like site-specific DNA recombinase
LLAAGVNEEHIYEDKASGTKDDRPGLAACLKSLRNNEDVLVIWKLDRLGRNLKHLIEAVEDLTKRGIGFKVINGNQIDTSTAKLNFQLFAMLAAFEHHVIRERTIARLAAARARGNKGGRLSAFTPFMLRRAQTAMKAKDISVTARIATDDASRPMACRRRRRLRVGEDTAPLGSG